MVELQTYHGHEVLGWFRAAKERFNSGTREWLAQFDQNLALWSDDNWNLFVSEDYLEPGDAPKGFHFVGPVGGQARSFV